MRKTSLETYLYNEIVANSDEIEKAVKQNFSSSDMASTVSKLIREENNIYFLFINDLYMKQLRIFDLSSFRRFGITRPVREVDDLSTLGLKLDPFRKIYKFISESMLYCYCNDNETAVDQYVFNLFMSDYSFITKENLHNKNIEVCLGKHDIRNREIESKLQSSNINYKFI